jgi:hypothetical protein
MEEWKNGRLEGGRMEGWEGGASERLNPSLRSGQAVCTSERLKVGNRRGSGDGRPGSITGLIVLEQFGVIAIQVDLFRGRGHICGGH